MNSTRRAPSREVIWRQIDEYYQNGGKAPSTRYLRALNDKRGSLETYSSELAHWKKHRRSRPDSDSPATDGSRGSVKRAETIETGPSAVQGSAAISPNGKRLGRPKKATLAGDRSFEELFAEMRELEEGQANTSNNQDADVGGKASISGEELDAAKLDYVAANAVGIIDYDDEGNEDPAPFIPSLVEDERKQRETNERQQRQDAAWRARQKNDATASPPPGGSFSDEDLLEELLVYQADRTGAEGAASSIGLTAPSASGTGSTDRSKW